MAFGELAMMCPTEHRSHERFYTAISLTECWVLQMTKLQFDGVVKEQYKKSLAEKTNFLKNLNGFG